MRKSPCIQSLSSAAVRAGGLRRTSAVWITLLGLWLLPVQALINPTFTPVNLVEEAQAIVAVTVRYDLETDTVFAEKPKVIKGEHAREAYEVIPAWDQVSDTLRERVFYEGKPVKGLLFLQRVEAGDGTVEESAYFSLGHMWFSLIMEDGEWIMEEGAPGMDLMAIWEGRTEMLEEAVHYILSSPNPVMPAISGAQWGEASLLGTLPTGLEDGTGDAQTRILVSSEADGADTQIFFLSPFGDRVWSRDPETGEAVDLTETLGLKSASLAGVLIDVNQDGRADLVSWDGGHLTVQVRNEEGDYVSWGGRIPLEECLSLEVLPTGPEGPSCLISTSAQPLRLTFASKENWTVDPLVPSETEFSTEGLKRAFPCVVADFDADSLPDVLQPFRAGALFYKGTESGVLPPVRQGDLFGGYGEMFPRTCDMDGDGMLDVILFGEAGMTLWRNRGAGRFDSLLEVGEPARFVRTGSTGGMVGDINNDGRRDFGVLYGRGGMQMFFNRGFATFGKARSMELAESGGEPILPESLQGQQAGLLYDWNRDGALDLILVLNDGTVFCVLREKGNAPLLAGEVALDASAAGSSPVRMVAHSTERMVGTWNLTPGVEPALVSAPRPGPLRLEFFVPGRADPVEKRLLLLPGRPARLMFTPEPTEP